MLDMAYMNSYEAPVTSKLPYILAGLAVALIAAYLIFRYVYTPWSLRSTLLERGPVGLGTAHTYSFNPFLQTGPSHTFTFYVKPDALNRTPGLGGERIMEWSGVYRFELLQGGVSNKSSLTTHLKVNTTEGEEVVQCPALPLQKWTYVSVSIEGRRVDIAYNGKIVGSRILNGLIVSTQGGKLESGSAGLVGTIGFVAYNNRRMSAEEVMIDYVSTSDTRGEPYLPQPMPSLGAPGCPANSNCYMKSGPTTSKVWFSPYN
jgi:hypothetical protein